MVNFNYFVEIIIINYLLMFTIVMEIKTIAVIAMNFITILNSLGCLIIKNDLYLTKLLSAFKGLFYY